MNLENVHLVVLYCIIWKYWSPRQYKSRFLSHMFLFVCFWRDSPSRPGPPHSRSF